MDVHGVSNKCTMWILILGKLDNRFGGIGWRSNTIEVEFRIYVLLAIQVFVSGILKEISNGFSDCEIVELYHDVVMLMKVLCSRV